MVVGLNDVADDRVEQIGVVGRKDNAMLWHGDDVRIIVDDADEVLIGLDAIDQGGSLFAGSFIRELAREVLNKSLRGDVWVVDGEDIVDFLLRGQVIEIDLRVIVQARFEELIHHRVLAFADGQSGENQHAAGEQTSAR